MPLSGCEEYAPVEVGLFAPGKGYRARLQLPTPIQTPLTADVVRLECLVCLYSPLRIRMNGLSIRKLFLIVICLLAASVLIDFAHMVLSMIIDSVLAVAIVYFLWRIKGQYEERIKELEAEVRLLMSRRSGG
jgi:hypothetical protein